MSQIVVAIDLGTSRSAWAYSIKDRAEDDIIIRIPDGSLPSASAMKTETAILLDIAKRQFVAFGRGARKRFIEETEETEWECVGEKRTGNPLAAEIMLFRHFKVELCQKRGYQSIHDPIATADGGQRVPLLHVFTEVLRHFKEDALAHLSNVSEAPQRVEDVTWAITIPAIYDDFGKRFMRHAAYEAGIISTIDSPRMQLCLEPEAACLAMNVKEAPALCEPGMKAMILDCGGGTVDITTNEVVSTTPLRLRELLQPTGGPWGSTCVDAEFKTWLQGFLGLAELDRVKYTSSFFALMEQWEDGKTTFGGGDDERVRLNLAEIATHLDINIARLQELRMAFNESQQESPDAHIKGGKFSITLPSCLVKSFFIPTTNRIAKCLRDLKRDPALSGLHHVFLVGGFSSSPLLQKVARAELEGDGCVVVAAIRPGVAIVRGAVLFANNTQVFTTRKARLTYGVVCSVEYNTQDPEHVDRRSSSPTFDDHGREMIDEFSRHVIRGDDIPVGGSFPMQSYLPLKRNQLAITFDIVASHMRDIRFPDKDKSFTLGTVTVPVDMNVTYENRGVRTHFIFGGTELSVKCFRKEDRKEIGHVQLSIVQDVRPVL